MILYFQSLIHLIQSEKETIQLSAGQRLYSQGNREFCMFLIKKGYVKLSSGEAIIEIGREGTIIGEESLLEGLPKLANATAVTDCLIIPIDQEHLGILRGMWPDLSQQLHESLQSRRKYFDVGLVSEVSA